MELTGSEREEFTRLANATFDPDLCSEEDLPWLRAARAEYEREQERERSGVSPVAQPSLTEDEEAMSDSTQAADDL
jgi:hypothetical protein